MTEHANPAPLDWRPAEKMIPTGIPTLDDVLGGGLVLGKVYVIGGRTMTGKSLVTQNIALNVARTSSRVYAAYLEESPRYFIQRIISSVSRVPVDKVISSKYRTGDQDQKIRKATQVLADEVDDGDLVVFSPTSKGSQVDWPSTPAVIRRYLTSGKDRGVPPALLIIDYLQLMVASGGEMIDASRELIDAMTDDITGIAEEFQIPVIITSQINRAPIGEKNLPPTLQDLAIATHGGLLNHATVVLLLHREELDSLTGGETSGELDVIVAKSPTGRVGTLTLGWFSHPGTAREVGFPFRSAMQQNRDTRLAEEIEPS